MEEPKAKSKSVSFLPELWEKVEGKARTDFGGNRSLYLRELVETDLAGGRALSPGFTAPQIDQWIQDELALIRAARIAPGVLDISRTEEERAIAAREMARLVIEASLRTPHAEPFELRAVAEAEPIPYGVTQPDRSEPARADAMREAERASIAAGKAAGTKRQKFLRATKPAAPAKVAAERH